MPDKKKPLWPHDCTRCTYIGTLGDLDFYYCTDLFDADLGTSYLVRYGYDGYENFSVRDFENRVYRAADKQYRQLWQFIPERWEQFLRRVTALRLLASEITGRM